MARRTLIDFFAGLSDPRVPRTRKHRLDDILVIAPTAMLSGATTFDLIGVTEALVEIGSVGVTVNARYTYTRVGGNCPQRADRPHIHPITS
jgi:hypothetical protein